MQSKRPVSCFSELACVLPRKRVLTVCVLVFTSSVAALPQRTNSKLQTLIQNGQQALDAGNLAVALDAFQNAYQTAPENLEANRGLLLTYLEANQLPQAAALGKTATAHWPKDAELQHWLGLAYFKLGQNQEALEILHSSEKIDAHPYSIHFDTALVLLTLMQYGPAADELELATKLKPDETLPHVLLGRAYLNSNRTLQSIEQFQTALRLDPSAELGHYHLGFAYASLGRNEEAVAEYKKEMARDPNNPEVAYQLGHCLLELGDWKSAIATLQQVNQSDPQNGDAAYDLGKALFTAGEVDDSVPVLQRAIDLKPADPSPHYQLARAFEKQGKKDLAHEEFQKFAELKKSQPQTGGMASGRNQ
jgi:tetratricopeptide (TPR) repeat protein